MSAALQIELRRITESPAESAAMGAFLAPDRRLPSSHPLAPRAHDRGAALIADLVGFSTHGDLLAALHGPRRGAEELARLLRGFHAKILEPIHRLRGSVVSFVGDAVIAWFAAPGEDEGEASRRAAAAACAIRDALNDLAPLPSVGRHGVRVCVASGEVRRLLVGDPLVQRLEVLMGPAIDTVTRLLHQANPGEVLLDDATHARLNDRARTARRRDERGEESWVLLTCEPPVISTPWPEDDHVEAEAARCWLPAPVFDGILRGEREFVSELRPAAVAFLRLSGLDYSRPNADAALDAWVVEAQQAFARWGGAVVDVTISDKGCCIYCAVGAHTAFEDASVRALYAVMDLSEGGEIGGVQLAGIGVAYGPVRVGIVGSRVRASWAATGRETNLAARLMEHARAGEVLVSERVAQAAEESDGVRLEATRMLSLKGFAEPVTATTVRFRAGGAIPRRSLLPAAERMVGREAELARLSSLLREAHQGRGSRVVRVEGDGGIGKSLLAAALMEHARRQGVAVLWGTGSPTDRGTPLGVWRYLLTRMGDLRVRVEQVDPEGAELLPLLADLVPGTPVDSARTLGLTEKARAEATISLIVRLLAPSSESAPRLILLDDAQWFDSGSWVVIRALADAAPRTLIVLCHRPWSEGIPPELSWLEGPSAPAVISLSGLATDAIHSLLCSSERVDSVAPEVLTLLTERTGGHPLFCQELTRALRDSGFVTVEGGRLCAARDRRIDDETALPDSIEAAIAARIDRLTPALRLTLKVASVLGTSFDAVALGAIHPQVGADLDLAARLAALLAAGIVRARTTPGEYVFDHAIVQEVAYQRLEASQRQALHRAAAEHLAEEQSGALSISARLAHHWLRAEEFDRARACLDELGRHALRSGAFHEAVEHLAAAQALDPAPTGTRSIERLCEKSRAHYRAGQLSEALACAEGAIAGLDRPVPRGMRMLVLGVLEGLRQWARRVGLTRPKVAAAAARQRLIDAATQYVYFSEICFLTSRFDLSMYAAVRQVNVAEGAGPSGPLAAAYGVLSIIAGTFGLLSLGRRYSALAEEVGRGIDADEATRAMIGHQRGMFRLGAGELAAVIQDHAEVLASFERCGDRGRVRDAALITLSAHYHAGAWSEAAPLLAQLTQLAPGEERFAQQAFALLYSAGIACKRGEIELARRELTALEALGRETAIANIEAAMHGLAAMTAMAADDPGEAKARAVRAVERLEKNRGVPMGVPETEAYLGASRVALWLWEGDPKGESALVERAGRLVNVGRRFIPMIEPTWRHHRGCVAWTRGRHERALAEWEAGLRAARGVGMIWEVARLLELTARH